MAITLNIELTDQEQARVVDLAEHASGEADLSPAQLKRWTEAKAKNLLRTYFLGVAVDRRREQENLARLQDDTSFSNDWDTVVPDLEAEPAP